MLSESDILTALRDCFDPEVKLNLVDLGLIYAVATGPDPDSTPAWPRQWVKVTMTLTTLQCPASGLIFEQVHNRLAGIADVSKVEVDPPQLFALGGKFIHGALHLAKHPLHLFNVAGESIPPGAQRLLLVQQRQGRA